jgi:serine/threonine protein kinase
MASVTVNDLMPALRLLLKPGQVDELTGSLSAEPQALVKDLCRRNWLSPFQARQLLLGKGAALVFGPYLILDLLGAGGRGQVFKARHRTLDRLVALKVLRKDLLADEEAVQRFFREVEVISQLSHPAIVHAYDADAVGSTYYLAMEFVEGTDLERLVKDSGQLPAAQACDFIRQAALGLQYAHERGLVHRDIKPSNLLVESRGSKVEGQKTGSGRTALDSRVVKILDLGLARLEKPAAGSRTQQLTVLAGNAVLQGTPDYLAPEQALDFHAADIRADIYSLGCTFFFLLTSQPPFPGGTLPQKLLRHQQAEPPDITGLRNDLPADVPGIMRKMLAKNPDDRYQTPAELATALTAALQAVPRPTAVMPATARRPPSAAALATGSTVDFEVERTPASGLLALPGSVSGKRTKAVQAPGVFKGRWPLIAGAGGGVLLLLLACLFLLPNRAGEPAESRDFAAATAPAASTPVIERSARPALLFDGKTTVLPLPDDLLRTSTTLSVESWFKTKSGGIMLGYQHGPYPTGGGEYVPALYVGSDGLLRGEVWYGVGAPVTSKAPVNDDRWHHVCLVADGAAKIQHLYLDGALLGSRPGDIQHLNMKNNQLGTGISSSWPGGVPGWPFFGGALAEVRFWSRPLTGDEVKYNREHTLTGKEPGLVLYLPLDEAASDVLHDRSAAQLKLKLFKDQKAERVPGGPPVK